MRKDDKHHYTNLSNLAETNINIYSEHASYLQHN